MKHRQTTGRLIVEMKVKAVCFDFQSAPHKSSLPHPRSHAVNILRAGPTPLICFTSVASNLPQFADPFTLSNRAVHLNLLTTGLLSLAFLHILHVARGSSWVCSLWHSADSYVPLSSTDPYTPQEPAAGIFKVALTPSSCPNSRQKHRASLSFQHFPSQGMGAVDLPHENALCCQPSLRAVI